MASEDPTETDDDAIALDAIATSAITTNDRVGNDAVAKSEPVARSSKKAKKRSRETQRSRPARIAIAVLRLFVIGYVTLLLGLVWKETQLVYPGAYFSDDDSRGNLADPELESVQYESLDGVRLTGRLLHRETCQDYLIFFHGNASKAKWLDSWAKDLSEQFDATVLVAEYRGFEDDITPDEKGVLADSFAAREYLCQRYDKRPDEIILYGRSLGGGCAVAVAAQGGAKALVLERTFDRLVNVASAKYPFVPIPWLMRNRYDSIAKLTVYDGPLVMVHGTTDTLIPIEFAQRLYESADCEPKRWIEVPGMGHNDELPPQCLHEIAGVIGEFTAAK